MIILDIPKLMILKKNRQVFEENIEKHFLGYISEIKTNRYIFTGSLSEIEKILSAHPQAKVMAHPECNPDVLEMADCVSSTAGMLKYAKASPATEFIVATEVGIVHQLEFDNPEKDFYPIENAICQTMKLITLENLYTCLKEQKYEVSINEAIAQKARESIKRMLEVK